MSRTGHSLAVDYFSESTDPPSKASLGVFLSKLLAGHDKESDQLRAELAEAKEAFNETQLACGELSAALDKAEAANDALTKRLEEAERLRPKVLAFALIMEEKLRANEHKGGWEWDHPNALITRLYEEADELRAVVKRRKDGGLERGIGKEAADVANFAMMVADVCGALTPSASPPQPVSAAEVAMCRRETCDGGIKCRCRFAREPAASEPAPALNCVKGCGKKLIEWTCPECRTPAPTLPGGGELDRNAPDEHAWFEQMPDGEKHPSLSGWWRSRKEESGWTQIAPAAPASAQGTGDDLKENVRDLRGALTKTACRIDGRIDALDKRAAALEARPWGQHTFVAANTSGRCLACDQPNGPPIHVTPQPAPAERHAFGCGFSAGAGDHCCRLRNDGSGLVCNQPRSAAVHGVGEGE